MHLPPNTPTGAICLELEEIAAEVTAGKHLNPAEVRFYTIQEGYDIPEKGAVVEALKKVYAQRGLAWQSHAFPSHSDANMLWANGIKPILLGPGSLAKAHTPDEFIDCNEVAAAAEIFYEMIKVMLNLGCGDG